MDRAVVEYARETGISGDKIRRLGGVEKLRSLSPEARAVLLRPAAPKNTAPPQRKISLAAIGMRSQVPGILRDGDNRCITGKLARKVGMDRLRSLPPEVRNLIAPAKSTRRAASASR